MIICMPFPKYDFPIKVASVDGTSVLITDNSDRVVGLFHEGKFISDDCTGKLFGTPPLGEIPWCCLKLFPAPTASVSVNGVPIEGDLNIVSNFTHSVSGSVVVTPLQELKPICEGQPIRQVNDTPVDSYGKIYLKTDTPHLTMTKVGDSIIEFGSDLHIEDFDKNKLVGPAGKMGPQGDPGADGKDAIAVDVSTAGYAYTFGYFDGTNFVTKNMQGKLVAGGYVYRDAFRYIPDLSIPSYLWPYVVLPHAVTAVNGSILGSADGYVYEGSTWHSVSAYEIVKVADRYNFITTNTICVNGVERPRAGETNIRKIGGVLYIISDYSYTINDSTLIVTTSKISDTNGTIFVGDKIGTVPSPQGFINRIEGNFMCGTKGALYELRGSTLLKYETPTVKNWSTLYVDVDGKIWVA